MVVQLWALLLAALLALVLATIYDSGVVEAQAMPIVLTVQLRTVANDPVPGVEVRVIDAASDQLLAKETTDGTGQARFTTIPPTEVRVRLAGALADGTGLRHARQDQQGIWVNLPARDWVMVLLADTDGLVFPDLGLDNAGAPDAGNATAIARGTLPTVYPTAPVATPVTPTSLPRAEKVLDPTNVPETGVHGPTLKPTSKTSGVGLLMLLIMMIAGVVWLSSRHKL